jgi:hypothetical protein
MRRERDSGIAERGTGHVTLKTRIGLALFLTSFVTCYTA